MHDAHIARVLPIFAVWLWHVRIRAMLVMRGTVPTFRTPSLAGNGADFLVRLFHIPAYPRLSIRRAMRP